MYKSTTHSCVNHSHATEDTILRQKYICTFALKFVTLQAFSSNMSYPDKVSWRANDVIRNGNAVYRNNTCSVR